MAKTVTLTPNHWPHVLLSVLFLIGATFGQEDLQQHYQSAQKAQAAGKLDEAGAEYKLFLGDALHRLATRRASLGDFAKAISDFDAALDLAPNDRDLQLDYIRVCREANQLDKARTATEKLVATLPGNAKAHLEFGLTLAQLNEDGAAKQELEKAVALDPNFTNGYALAQQYLKLKDRDAASTIFAEMLKGLGDTAELHMNFGRAYAQAGYPEQGIQEFKLALAKDPANVGAHYLLGATYLIGLGDAALGDAEEEFRLELKAHPDDFYSLYQLGNISLSQHKLDEAERYLSRAATLQRRNPDPFLSLGQVYVEMGRAIDAETTLRKSIELTRDESRNRYQVQRSHYLLGRLLLQAGDEKEAKEELKISDRLLRLTVAKNQGASVTEISSNAAGPVPLPDRETPPDADPEALKRVEEFEARVAPAIADSYNNLGVMAASHNDLATALHNFQRAAAWDPSLEGLDFNWGKAAFSAGDYSQAISPLERYLSKDPSNLWARGALGSSYFSVKNYSSAVKALQPMEGQFTSPQLDFIYSASLVKTGEFDRGVKRLQDLEAANPGIAAIPAALGEAFGGHGDTQKAEEEYRKAEKLGGKASESRTKN